MSNTLSRALKLEISFPGWRSVDLMGKTKKQRELEKQEKNNTNVKRTGARKKRTKKMDGGDKKGLLSDLLMARWELTTAMNRGITALFAVRQGVIKSDVLIRTLSYQALSGKWQPFGRPLYTPKGRRLGSAVLLGAAGLLFTRINEDFQEIRAGKKSLSTFREVAFPIASAGVKVDAERGMIVLNLWEGGGKITVQPVRMDNGSREVFRRICTGAYRSTDAKLWRNDRDKKWYLSLGWEGEVEEKPVGLVCGVDLRWYARAHLRYCDPATGLVSRYKDVVKVPENVVRAWDAVESERSRRSEFNRKKYDLRTGRGRSRKARVVECLSDRRANMADSATRMVCATIVKQAKFRGASEVVAENLTGFTDDFMTETEVDETLTYASRARWRKRFLLWQQGRIRSLLRTAVEAEGMTYREIDPAYTSMTCSQCGKVWSTPPKEKPEFGLVTFSRFRCDCGNQGFAPWNAAANIVKAGILAKELSQQPPEGG